MDWMKNLSEAQKQLPISQLAIPGSHDSGAFYLDRNGPLSPGEEPMFQFVKPAVYNWSITQSLDFEGQLNIGIRYFDLRIAPHPETQELCVVHALFGNEIKPVLYEIKSFLHHHPSEVVILDFNHLLGFTEESNSKLISMITDCFGAKLAGRRNSFDATSLSSLLKAGKQVIVFYAKETTNEFLWSEKLICNPWPNVQTTGELVKCLDSGIAEKTQGACYVSQGVLTPVLKTCLFHLMATLKSWENDCGLYNGILEWINKPDVAKQINIVFTDFVDEQFVQTVIKCNDKN
uniref:PI-PLC X domain-containing protein 2-like n=1 Tax=Phallusia mammillata TaxID=59560 RepID=A0A6F9DP13_9ASCI|nr:PI-PLC X domain-containing protein 2-like [Phallusia mammillata]